MKADIRKTVVLVEDTHKEMRRAIDPPTRRAVAIAVIANPFAGEYVENLEPLMEIGAELGAYLGDKAVAALGIAPSAAESYGKAAVVGERGELEHAAAILHPGSARPCARRLRRALRWCRRSKKRAGRARRSTYRSAHKDAAYVRSHFDGIEVRIPDAPCADEILVAVAVTDSGRPLPRVGGLTVDEVGARTG